MKVKEIKKVVEIPEGVDVLLDEFLTIKGPKGEIKKKFAQPQITLSVDNKKILVISKGLGKKTKRVVNAIAAHIKNAIKGVSNGYEYKLKICSGHFPMNVAVVGDEFIIKNFLGEKYPRTMKIKYGVRVNIMKDEIIVSGIDKNNVGQVAADIEQLTRISNRDRRVFQDGIHIISKT